MDLEKSYCADVNSLGVQGWLKYLSDDVVFTTHGHGRSVKGKDCVKKRLEGLYNSDKVFYTWDVQCVDVSDDYTLAYSYSLYTFKIINGEDVRVYIGKDCNIWKLINGVYKVVMQIGNRTETKFNDELGIMAKKQGKLKQ